MDQDASKSALNYLLQEVSKLAPPIHHTPSTTEGRVALCQPSGSLCQRGPPCVSPHKRIRMDKCHSKTGSMLERRRECYSPWRVLSLINLQCERLLHQRDVEECDPTSASYTIVFGQSADGSGETGAAGTHQGVEDGCYCIECTLRQPLICERQEITACVNPIEDFEGVDESCEPQCFGLQLLPQSSEKQCVSNSELVQEDAPVSSQPTQRNDSEVKFRCPAREEQAEQVDFSTKPDVFSLPIPENDMSPKHISDASLQLTFNASISLSGPAFILDHNANIVVSKQPPCDHDSPLLCSHSDSPSFSTEEGCQLLSEPLDQIKSKPECARLTEEESPAVAPLTPSSDHEAPSPSPSITVKSEHSLAEEGEEEEGEEEDGSNLPCTHQSSSKSAWRSKTPRKQANPSRSANVEDPHFQGVTFRMDTELDDSKEQCRLLITSKYSKELNKGARKSKLRIRTSQRSPKVCCSEEGGDPTNPVSRGKVCASCCTKKTPMWRDAEDGTPLCNACGIRYKKYRVRCVNCWHIPRKEGNSNSCCLKCGNFVQLTSTQRKHTT